MKKVTVGLIVAIEMASVFDYYKNVEELKCPSGYKLFRNRKEYCDIYILRTGMGEIAAAAGTQFLITNYGVDFIVNFGCVGGLTERMSTCKLCVVDRVVHYKYDCSEFMNLQVGQVDGRDSIYIPTDRDLLFKALAVEPDMLAVTCCSGDKFVSGAEEKRELHEKFGGEICEMEAAGVLLTCIANDVPCLMLKAVSDGLLGGAEEFYVELYNASLVCLKATDRIIEQIT